MRRLDAAARTAAPGSFVTLPGGVTHYEISAARTGADGNGQTPVILVHGFFVPSFVWEPTFAGLARAGIPVIRYDLFGRGYSDRPRMTYSIDLFERQLADLIEALDLAGPVDIAGLSMGGAVSIGFADRHPEMVRRLALFDPAGFPMPSPAAMTLLDVPVLGEIAMATVGKRMMISGLSQDFHAPEQLPALARQYVEQMRYPGFLRALLSTIRHGPIQSMADAYVRVGRHPRPVLLVWGENDKTVPFAVSGQVRAALPRAEFHAIEGAGHVPHLEQPELINRILVDFLTR
ncbi:MAG: alpha/beta fold hydrolase [Anaerolineae bacterium]|nr:alpha/beta fold hydrolase [Anaerolineae bacterium]